MVREEEALAEAEVKMAVAQAQVFMALCEMVKVLSADKRKKILESDDELWGAYSYAVASVEDIKTAVSESILLRQEGGTPS